MVTLALSLGAFDAAAAPWDIEDARGCIAATEAGDRVACLNLIHGRIQLEAKQTTTRRLYHIELLGSEQRPAELQATPASAWRKAVSWLQKKGYRWLEAGTMLRPGTWTVPGARCSLSVDAAGTYVETVAASEGDKRRPWMEVGPPGGEATLHAASVHGSSRRLFLVIEHRVTDAEGVLVVHQIKNVPLEELLSRKECGPE